VKSDSSFLNASNKLFRPPLDRLNINKTFEEIVDTASKDENQMLMLRTILTEGKRSLIDKQAQIKKRQLNLKNSNLTEQEYRKKQKEIGIAGESETREIKEDLYNKLCASKVKGFDTKETITENIKDNLLKKKEVQEIAPAGDIEVEIQESDFLNYKNDLMILIDKLINEKLFTGGLKNYDGQQKDSRFSMNPSILTKDKDKGIVDKDKNIMNQENTDEKPKKAGSYVPFSDRMESNIPRKKNICLLNESVLQPRNDLPSQFYEKFDWQKLTQTNPEDKILMKRSEIENLSDLNFQRNKNDGKTQQSQCEKLMESMRSIEKNCEFDLQNIEENTMKELISISNFILYGMVTNKNNNSEGSMIHPNDMIYLLNKFE